MFISIKRFAYGALLCGLTLGCHAQGSTLSAPFDLCVKPLKGVTFDPSTGLDADVVHAAGKGAKASIYVGQHPDIPPGMNIQRDRKRYVPRDLGSSLQFIAESSRRDGHGLVRLYGYDRAKDDQILILVSAEDGKANASLVKAIGDALVRCKGGLMTAFAI